jgi:mono/diheme cytochrome c family protein
VLRRITPRDRRARRHRRSDVRRLTLAAGITALIAVVAACGGAGGDTAGSMSDPPPGTAAARGKELSLSRGCAGCHGADFAGGAGPTWIGIAGEEVELVDGTTVVRDEAYLIRSIAEPNAEIVAGYTLRMPANNLTDDEVADIVAFIQTLGGETQDSQTSDGQNDEGAG